GVGDPAGDLPRVFSVLARVQHPRPMRIPDRLHDDPDAAGPAGGLRRPDAPRPRRLALKRLVRALLAAALGLGVPAPAPAHSLLLESTPAADSTVAVALSTLSLRFNHRVETLLSRLRLYTSPGALVRFSTLASVATAYG